jgi:hypothetical protein
MIWPPQDSGVFEAPQCVICGIATWSTATAENVETCDAGSFGVYTDPVNLRNNNPGAIASCRRFLDLEDGETEHLESIVDKFRWVRTGLMASHSYDLTLPLYFNAVYSADITDTVMTDSDGTLVWEVTMPAATDPGAGVFTTNEYSVVAREVVYQ